MSGNKISPKKQLEAAQKIRAIAARVTGDDIEGEVDSLFANIMGACDLIEVELQQSGKVEPEVKDREVKNCFDCGNEWEKKKTDVASACPECGSHNLGTLVL